MPAAGIVAAALRTPVVPGSPRSRVPRPLDWSPVGWGMRSKRRSIADGSGQHLEGAIAMPFAESIGRRVVTIEGKDLAQLQALGEHHERGVGEIHRTVGIAEHQLKGPNLGLVVQEPKIETMAGHEVHQSLGADAAGGQQVEGFGSGHRAQARGVVTAQFPRLRPSTRCAARSARPLRRSVDQASSESGGGECPLSGG
jgi:hypothetical protein